MELDWFSKRVGDGYVKLKFDSSIICWMDNYLKILTRVPENPEKAVPQNTPEMLAITIIDM